MADTDEDRMRALEERIEAAKSRSEPPRKPTEEHYSQAQLAWRMVIELVAGVAIGLGMGYGMDWLLDTGPWLMIIFLILGFIAGVKTMVRSAKEIQADAETRAATGNGPGTKGTQDGD